MINDRVSVRQRGRNPATLSYETANASDCCGQRIITSQFWLNIRYRMNTRFPQHRSPHKLRLAAFALLTGSLLLFGGISQTSAQTATPQDLFQIELPTETVPPPPLRYWPHEQEIRLGYRLIGDYGTLLGHLRASRPSGLGSNWEEDAYVLLHDVNVEQALLDRIEHYSRLTGLSIVAEQYTPLQSTSSFDICITIYLSDRDVDLEAFSCAQEMHERIKYQFTLDQELIPWGINTIYHNQLNIQGSACIAAYSAFTFQEDLKADQIPHEHRAALIPPFFPFEGDTPFGRIFAQPRGFFEETRYRTDRIRRRDNTLGCQIALRETYQSQIDRIINACLISAVGIPISDAYTPAIFDSQGNKSVLNRIILTDAVIGSALWLGLVGAEASRHEYRTARLEYLEGHADAVIRALYEHPMDAQQLADLERTIEQSTETLWRSFWHVDSENLFEEIELQCLGPS